MHTEAPCLDLPIPAAADGFSRLPLAAFWAAHRPEASLYVQSAAGKLPKLLCARGFELRDEHLQAIYDSGNTSVFIANSELACVAESLQKSIDVIMSSAQIPAHERAAILQVAEAPRFGAALRLVDGRRAVESAQSIGARLAPLLYGQDVDVPQLYSSLQHDDRPSTRAFNGAAYALVLAERMGLLGGVDEAAELVVGALLRDLGERLLPATILAKPTRLSGAERSMLEAHPTIGYAELRQQGGLAPAQLMMVYQHHECFQGDGYPVGALADEIHPWAQALAVVDAFESLTGCRAYREPVNVAAALRQIEAGASTQFHPEMTLCWSKAFRT